ncbi:hypothetical protein [Actinospongicola halichondriae]|uniref:hypothetical protein n=1 Tax=Actinospongicola halichondriae TaxID=3236844 RepID=UPI003D442ABE
MKNLRFLLAVLLAVVGNVVLFVPTPASAAASAPTSAWWSRAANPQPTDEVPAALPVPPPDSPVTVPAGAAAGDGQLVVESTPEGAVAIAAVRWDLASGDSSPSLTLPIGPGSTLNPQSIVLACRAAAPWSSPDTGVGTWNAKPLVDGGACVNGVIADDLSSIGFGLQPLVSGTTLDVVLTPGKDTTVAPPEGAPEPPIDLDRSTFRWTFAAPDSTALEVVEGDFVAGEGDQTVVPDPVEVVLPDDTAEVPSLPNGPAFDTPTATTAPPPPVAAPALEPDELATAAPVLRPAASLGTGANRTVGVVFLVLAAAMAAWAHLSDPRDESLAGGLSRFARPRTGSPTPLS